LVNLAGFVCPGGPPCPFFPEGIGARDDGVHYSAEGSLWVARWLLPRLGIPALRNPDTSLPLLTMVLPKPASTLEGTSLLAVKAPFKVGVTRVDFEVSGPAVHDQVIGTGSVLGQAWTLNWDTTTVPNGAYTIRSVAYGAAGTHTVSDGIAVRVTN
jgi:hypothetical protein